MEYGELGNHDGMLKKTNVRKSTEVKLKSHRADIYFFKDQSEWVSNDSLN